MKSKTDKLLNDLFNLHPKYIDLSLDRLVKLLKKLGDPHLNLPKTIHIAGTNGKGSIQSFIKNIIVSNGYSCDAYTSPHLTKFNERIVINNKNISTKKLYQTLEFVKKINNYDPITFFEITTATAMLLFQRSNSDFLILETGLGGRLDATNIIPSKLFSIITPISYDHEEFLGNTIQKITREKLGIVNKSSFVIISKQKKEVKEFIKKKLIKNKNVYFYGKNFKINNLTNNSFQFHFDKNKRLVNKPKLHGIHQIENASVALAFSEIMEHNGFKINFNKTNLAIKKTTWPGRIELLRYKGNRIILDGSHNESGAESLKKFLATNRIKPIVLFGMLNNKKIDIFLKLIKTQIDSLIPIKIPDENNSFKRKEIIERCKVHSIKYYEMKSISDFMKYISNSKNKIFLVTGSLYLVGKLRPKFL